MEINFDAIRQDVPIQSVLAMFGKPYKEKGKFPCVAKDHADKRPSMSIIHKSNRCYCYACNAVFDPVDLVQQEIGCTRYEAVDYLIQQLNLKETDYVTKDEDYEEPAQKVFPFTNAEMNQLGLCMNYGFSVVTNDDMKTLMEITANIEQDESLTKRLSREELRKEILFEESLALKNPSGKKNINMVRLFRENEPEFYVFLQMATSRHINELEKYKAIVEYEYRRQKKEFFQSGNKKDRDKIVRKFLDYIKEDKPADFSYDEKTVQILRAYIPLYETYKNLKSMEDSIEQVKSLLDRIPEQYRTDFFSLVDEVAKIIPFEKEADFLEETLER